MSARHGLNAVLLIGLLAVLGANVLLSSADPERRNLEFLPTMVHSVPYDTFAAHPNLPLGMAMQLPPEGSIARGQMPLHYAPTAEDALRAGQELVNPYAAALLPADSSEGIDAGQAEALETGAELYRVYCGLCHGSRGDGDGVVAQRGFPAPPQLYGETGLALLDGQIFHIISHGQNNMPGHASQLERARALDDRQLCAPAPARRPGTARLGSPGARSGAVGPDRRGGVAVTVAPMHGLSSADLAQVPRATFARLLALVVTGLVIWAGGAALAPSSFWPSLLMIGYYVFGLGIGAFYFLATHHAANAGWATVLKRVPESMLVLVPVGAGIIAIALAFGAGTLYPWLGAEMTGFKGVWLSLPFFYLRSLVYLTVLPGLALALRRRSLLQDSDPSIGHTRASFRLSVVFLTLGSVLLCAASIDWFMSAEPAWFSTMYGVYHFAGNFVTGIALITLIVLAVRGQGQLPGLNAHHFHDLGKLLFAMSTFWMYIWFCQFMLIWYTNMPEETIYYTRRLGEGKTLLFLALPLLNWGIPFFVLMSQRAKRSATIVGRVCVVLLLGHWLDLFLMSAGDAGSSGVAAAEVGAGLAAIGVALYVSYRALTRVPLVALGDPYLDESLHHHG